MADLVALPPQGVPAGEILAELRALRERDLPTHGGRLFAYVYDPGLAGLDDLTAAAHAAAAHVNGLDPTAFPSVLAIENALVRAAAGLLGGGPGTVGNVTGGGTESLLLAVKAARDSRPDIAVPRLVAPVTAHAAFAKACSYLRVKFDPVPVDGSLRVDPAALAAAVGPDTVLVACSAPAYAHGLIDPVEEIAAVAAERGVRCHVDACFGGWTLPYLRRLGAPIPPFDLSVDGVTSISVDLHKYAYAPKGVSLLLHKSASLRAPQYFAFAGWPGYTVVNATAASTRSGGPIAAAYATMRRIGDDGYLRLAADAREAVAGLAAAVSSVDGLRLVAAPESTVVAFTVTESGPDLFVLVDELTARGWHTQAQFAFGPIPRSIHLTVTASVLPQVKAFEADLREATSAASASGPVTLPEGILDSLDPGALTPSAVAGLAAGLGFGSDPDGGPLPQRMAVVNTLLDAAPPELREALLTAFLGLLQTP